MIRVKVTESSLHAAIEKTDAEWFDKAAAVQASLPASPASSDFKPLWSRIKQVYIDLQFSKCCFCEKPLEGKIEQDVEHFRPKSEVKPWKVPDRLADEIVPNQAEDGTSEAGYSQLAYEPLNYAMACKTCNSVLKKNFFPIEGTRDSKNTDPAAMTDEKALLIYPIDSVDTDPEDLIEFSGLSPVTKASRGFGRRRALTTIDIFRLDDSVRRREIFKQRGFLLRLLFLELEGKNNSSTAAKRKQHQEAIDVLISAEAPFANCMRSFERLYAADRTGAEAVALECLKFMKSKSVRRGR